MRTAGWPEVQADDDGSTLGGGVKGPRGQVSSLVTWVRTDT